MKGAPKILALDTSSRGAAVALLEGDRVVVRKSRDGRPAEGLLGIVEQALSEAGWALEGLGLVVVGVGPGSFTGTRVGLATAKGLALAREVPVVGVGSLVARARAHGPEPVGIITDAGRKEAYGGAFVCPPGAPAQVVVAPFLASPARALARLEGRPVLADPSLGLHAPPAPPLDAGVLGHEGWLRFRERGPDDPAALEPSYVRPSDAKLPEKPLRVSQSSSSSKSDA